MVHLHAGVAGGLARTTTYTDNEHAQEVRIFVHELPEGVLLAVSPDVDGLTIEAQNMDELRAEVKQWAPDLLRDNHGYTGGALKYIYSSPRRSTFLP